MQKFLLVQNQHFEVLCQCTSSAGYVIVFVLVNVLVRNQKSHSTHC